LRGVFHLKNKINILRILAINLTFIIIFGLLPASAYASAISFSESDDVTVYMSFEGFTLGHGFYIEPTEVLIPAGSSLAAATQLLLNEQGHTFNAGGMGGGFFLDRVFNFNASTASPPSIILSGLNDWHDSTGQWFMLSPFNPTGSADGSLGSSDYYGFSGWMFTVNHEMPSDPATGWGLTADDVVLNGGEVIRWQFSLAAGLDVGFSDDWMGTAFFTHADKTDLIRALFNEGVDPKVRQNALDVIINPFASAQEVADAIDSLQVYTVYISFEGYNLGLGFFIEPTAVSVPTNFSVMDVTEFILTQNNISYLSPPWGGLDRIQNIYSNDPVNPPPYITIELTSGSGDGSLGSLDYSEYSGWIFTVDHVMPFVGANDVSISNGDVIRWQFSVEGWGADLGLGMDRGFWSEPLYTHADKTDLIRALFAAGATQAAIPSTLSIIIDPMATEVEVSAAIAALLDGQALPSADKTSLNAVITAALSHQQGNYTPRSWANLQSALTAAQAVNSNAHATQVATDRARDRLQTAVNDLFPATQLPPWQIAMQGSLAWLFANTQSPAVGSVGGEWAVIALSRANISAENFYENYLTALGNELAFDIPPGSNWNLSGVADFQRITLALSALGIDATDFNGRDLTAGFGTNPLTAAIFSLIALDSRAYSGDRTQYINAILNAAKPGGGWGIGSVSAVDLTAMAIQALAPYYNNNANVAVAVDLALEWLNAQTVKDAEGNAQSIIALSALGIDAKSYVDALLEFLDPQTGGFLRGVMINRIATEQAALALVAYDRFLSGGNRLFNMNDAGAAARTVTPPTWTPPSGGNWPDDSDDGDDGGIHFPVTRRAFISVRNDHANRTFFSGNFDIIQGETALSLLQRTGLEIVTRGAYVVSIGGLTEFDHGPQSGWMFRVNGTFPQAAASAYQVRNGDRVEWLYTRNLGQDVGGGFFPPLPPPEDDCDEDEDEDEEETEDISESEEATENIIFSENIFTVESLRNIIETGLSLTVQTDTATATFDSETLVGLVYGKSDDTIIRFIAEAVELNNAQQAIAGVNTAVFLSVIVGDEIIRNFAGTVSVTIPYTPTTSLEFYDLLTVYHLDDFANITEMPDAEYYDGEISFSTNHFSLFFISEWISPFADISRDDWFFRNVRFVYSNELMTGTAQSEFAPGLNLTRAMLVTILWRLEDEPITEIGGAFTDVSPGAWYSNAVAWANENGIVNGYGGGLFGPNDNVTREQFAVILQNFARFKNLNTGGNLIVGFADSENISAWALESMQWAVANGIISGRTSTTLAPNGTATRAESAAMLQRFIEEFKNA